MKLLKLNSALVFVAVLAAGCGGVLKEEAHVRGTVSGLAGGTSVKLLNNGVDSVTVQTNGGFTFSQTLSPRSPYNVTVNTQPTGAFCVVLNGTGKIKSIALDVTDVEVNCAAAGVVTASVSGLAPNATLVLSNNNVDQMTVLGTASGHPIVQGFPKFLSAGSSYSVAVKTPPAGQNCVVANATGSVSATGNPSPALVTCS